MSEFDRLARAYLDDRAAASLLRARRAVEPIDPTRVRVDGVDLIQFCSNDYLGLAHHSRVIDSMRGRALLGGARAGSGAAPLISGRSSDHAAAERAIADHKGVADAVLLPSGYQANVAALQAVGAVVEAAGFRTRFLLDRLAHASLLDAARLVTGSDREAVRVFPHNDLTKLARLLDGATPGTHDVVVTESIFSMDGDEADLRGIVELRRRRTIAFASAKAKENGDAASLRKENGDAASFRKTSCVPVSSLPSGTAPRAAGEAIRATDWNAARPVSFTLVLDEAHATGIVGPNGAGLASELGLTAEVDVGIATLSKAIGVSGGAVYGSSAVVDAVVNAGRAYLFSTSPPAALARAAVASIAVLRDEPARRERLMRNVARLRSRLADRGIAVPAGRSPIVPVVLNDERAALAASARLRERGYLVIAVRPPTVPRGTSRLRITVTSEHSVEQIEGLVEAMVTAIS